MQFEAHKAQLQRRSLLRKDFEKASETDGHLSCCNHRNLLSLLMDCQRRCLERDIIDAFCVFVYFHFFVFDFLGVMVKTQTACTLPEHLTTWITYTRHIPLI